MKKILFFIIVLCFAKLSFSQVGLNIGDKVIDFKLLNTNSKHISLSDYTNEKGVVVIFTCNHCPYAQGYEDRIIQLHKNYVSKGFPVLAINPNDSTIVPDDSYSNMQKRAKEKQYPFPYLLDNNHQTQIQFGATKTPHVYLLEKVNRQFVVKYIGTIDDSPKDPLMVKVKYLEDAINSLIAGKKPDPEVTKAIGCSIKVRQE